MLVSTYVDFMVELAPPPGPRNRLTDRDCNPVVLKQQLTSVPPVKPVSEYSLSLQGLSHRTTHQKALGTVNQGG